MTKKSGQDVRRPWRRGPCLASQKRNPGAKFFYFSTVCRRAAYGCLNVVTGDDEQLEVGFCCLGDDVVVSVAVAAVSGGLEMRFGDGGSCRWRWQQ